MILKENSCLSAEARRELIKPLILKGLTSREIAKELGVSAITIRRDFQKMHKDFLSSLSENAAEVISFEVEIKYRELERIAWDLTEEATDVRSKLKCIQTLASLISEKNELLLRLGIIKEREPSTFENIFIEAINELQKKKK